MSRPSLLPYNSHGITPEMGRRHTVIGWGDLVPYPFVVTVIFFNSTHGTLTSSKTEPDIQFFIVSSTVEVLTWKTIFG